MGAVSLRAAAREHPRGRQIRRSADALASTTVHALLQIVTVALGSPLGREVAPREIGSALAGWLSRRAGLSVAQSRIMVACGAGAGLAAVYNVPLGGAVFVLEVLLGTFGWPALVPAIVTSSIAALVAQVGLGNEHQYLVPSMTVSPSLSRGPLSAGRFSARPRGASRN